MYLVIAEQILMLAGIVVFLVSLGMYVLRSGDFKSILVFWQATIEFSKREFIINRVGLSMMVAAVLVRFYNYFMA